MGFYWITKLPLLLGLLGIAMCQDCVPIKGGNRNCPRGTREVFQDEIFGQQIKLCCRPGTTEESDYHKLARQCRVTDCAHELLTDSCSTLPTRIYKGETLTYEEISRNKCTTSANIPGVSAFCCRTNSSEGFLAATNGAEKNEFPHMALLHLGGGLCGGTIYNKRYIITAAHCIVNSISHLPRKPDSIWIANVGRYIGSIEMPENDYIIEEAIPHENYSDLLNSPELEEEYPQTYNDIALLKLNRDINFGPTVKSIKIAPEGFDELQYADKAVIIGWGTTDTLDISENLQKNNFVIRTDKSCFDYSLESSWPFQYNSTEKLLCVGGVKDGIWSPTAGEGDSGGPAVCRSQDGLAVLCGVTSYGGSDTLCAENNDEKYCKPSVYTEVDHFERWIREHAGEQDESTFHNAHLYGEEPPKHRREHQVHITSDDGKPCGGTLVSADTVVTAAQCVAPGDGSGRMYSGLKVTSGTTDVRNPTGKEHGVKRVVILDGFKRKGKEIDIKEQGNRVGITDVFHSNDLAVIKLENGVTLKANAFPKLPEIEEEPSNPAYELAFPRETSRGGSLQQRQFSILDKDECQRRMNRMERVNIQLKVDDDVLCGVEKYSGGSTCDRELGGGLICERNGRETLCGVQIFRLCEWSIPNWFVDMALYSDWAREAMNL